MPKIGLKKIAFAPIATEPDGLAPTYRSGFVVGEAVQANLSLQMTDDSFYSDDARSEHMADFVSGTLDSQVNRITPANARTLYGKALSGSKTVDNVADTTAVGIVAYYQVLVEHGVRAYRCIAYPKAQVVLSDDSASTKGQNYTFVAEGVKFSIMRAKNGDWRWVEEFSTEAAAAAWVDTVANVATWYRVSVQVNGAGSGESAAPSGVSYVAAGSAFELAVTGTPTALYDNGTEAHANISGGKYTVTAAAADHDIAVIF